MRNILKQIWRFLAIAASGPGKWLSLLLLAIVIGCSLAIIQVNLRLVQWSADFYNALQKLDVPVAINQIGIFFALTGTVAGLYLVGRYFRKVLQIRWRRRLTSHLVDGWTSHKAYWLLSPALAAQSAADGGKASPVIDNPDQRIAEDCNLFTEFVLGRDEGMRSGILDFIMSLIGLYAYASLLWSLSTFALSFTLFGVDFEIPRYMFWIAPVYVAIACVLTHGLGRPLSGLLAEEQKREADFRSALIHVRENASGIAISDGETAERRMLGNRFEGVSQIWHQVIRREFIYGLFQRPYFQTVLRVPTFLALPAFLAGKATLGGLMQLAQAFSQVVTTLSWFVFNYKFLSDLVATTRRLERFLDSIEGINGKASGVERIAASGDALHVSNLAVCTPGGRVLIEIGDLRIQRGQTVWLRGVSGLGKSTLFKALAGHWPHASGRIELPRGRLCFLPQQVYQPLDSLTASAIYPALPETVSTIDAETLLRKVGLGQHLGPNAPATGLSIGEQQRLALARVLAARPDWAFLDEATSALDVESERSLMTILREELPDTTFVIVAHREPHGLSNVVEIELGTPRSQRESDGELQCRVA